MLAPATVSTGFEYDREAFQRARRCAAGVTVTDAHILKVRAPKEFRLSSSLHPPLNRCSTWSSTSPESLPKPPYPFSTQSTMVQMVLAALSLLVAMKAATAHMLGPSSSLTSPATLEVGVERLEIGLEKTVTAHLNFRG